MADAMKRLRAIMAEVTDIQRAGAVLDWDQETYMPPGGIQNRADQASTLSEVAHRRFTTDQLEAIFEELRTAIVPLVAGIARHADAVDDSVLHRGFDTDKQVQYALDTVVKLGYDLERGRQDISTHPFSIAFGPGDVRITTRVNRDFFNECLFGSIHEAGHGMYFQGIGRNIDRTPLWDGASPGVHESQSRLWENLVGRSLPFWRHFYPSLRAVFPEPLRGIEAEAFYRAVNRAYPSLIRSQADEVTYNLQILIRF